VFEVSKMKLDDDIHNYYEHLVLERIAKLGLDKTKTADYLADLCCLALNQVPPRYIRFEVDMAFYLPQSERRQMEMNVEYAISKALRFLNDAEKNEKPQGPDSDDSESINIETEASVNLAAEDLKND
jgi:phage gp36-like protein